MAGHLEGARAKHLVYGLLKVLRARIVIKD